MLILVMVRRKLGLKKRKGLRLKLRMMILGKALIKGTAAILSIIDYGMDAPIDLVKALLEKEQDKTERHTPVYGLVKSALTGSRYETHSISGSFSFALMMTCIGILIILFVLVVTLL